MFLSRLTMLSAQHLRKRSFGCIEHPSNVAPTEAECLQQLCLGDNTFVAQVSRGERKKC